MNIICYIRYLNINDKHIIYIEPHFYKSYKNLKTYMYKEKECLQQTVKMIAPIILGNYNITKQIFKKICLEHFDNYCNNNRETPDIFTFEFENLNQELIKLTLDAFTAKLKLLLIQYNENNNNNNIELPYIITNPESIFIKLK